MIKAINTASNFIYIEDQYGIYVKDVFDALHAALERGVGHIVVLIQIPDPESAQFGYDSYQADMWNPLKEAFPGKVQVYERNDEVYVHSKIVVVDDVWMAVGSQVCVFVGFGWLSNGMWIFIYYFVMRMFQS